MVDTKGTAETTSKRYLLAAVEFAGLHGLPSSKTQRLPFEAAIGGSSIFTWFVAVSSKRAYTGQHQR